METEARITGVMVYYYFVCKRKLWYFTHEIQMEQENEAVKLGKVMEEKISTWTSIRRLTLTLFGKPISCMK